MHFIDSDVENHPDYEELHDVVGFVDVRYVLTSGRPST